jgi:CRISPR system Cascade subunit CasA
MNGGHASRSFLGLAPRDLSSARIIATRPGAHFARDVKVLLETRTRQRERYNHLQYPETGGLGLTWLAPWPEGEQLQLQQLDIWFIEVCRRIRLKFDDAGFAAWRGKSNASRIKADHLKGVLGDPWAPVHKVENKCFTPANQGFDYRVLINLLLSGDWESPVLAHPASFESESDQQILIAQSLVRGQNKTEGFKSRLLPIGGRIMRLFGLDPQREKLHKLAQDQLAEIKFFGDAISYALQLYAAKGNKEELAEKLKSQKSREKLYALAAKARAQLDLGADKIFFEHLWTRFEVQDQSAERLRFAKALHQKADVIFEASLPSIPCASIFRPRAEARARSAFRNAIWKHFPELFAKEQLEETVHA